MKKNFNLLMLVALLCGVTSQGFAQRNCASHEHLQEMLQQNPEMQKNIEAIERHTENFIKTPQSSQRAVVTIPVVFHIVWRSSKPAENISDAQVMSQLDVMNNDFRKLNADASKTPSLFAGLAADTEIQFCLAQQTPAGASTSGIVRYQSSRTTDWGTNDAVKKPASGGYAPWDATKYLNIWVCSIGGGILGYAQFPGGAVATDGVVIDYRYFGTTGTATAPYNLGRTATHEVGHWLNLRHIWGDATCGSDLVADTPTHTTSNGGCPAFPKTNTCGGTTNTEMTMNYMDYTDDACMYMFSNGQKSRMQAIFATGGARASLLSSNGCQPVSTPTCGVPAGLSASAIATTSATVSWGAVTGASSYTIQYKLTSAAAWTTLLGITTTSTSLTGLTANSNYTIQVAAVCGTATGTYSPTTSFTTTALSTGCTDNYEPNNTLATSAAISAGTSIQALISTSTDQDWFKVSTTAASPKLQVTLSNLPANYDIFLYNASNQTLTSSSKTGTTTETIKYNKGTGAATYYIKISGKSGAFSATQCYTLLAEIAATNFREGNFDTDESQAIDFELYPNPASEHLALSFTKTINADAKILVTDMTGRNVTVSDNYTYEGTNVLVDVSRLNSGVYYVTYLSKTENITKKFVIAR